ncbi:MAG: ferritin [Anaerolineae bacterium]
MKQALQDMMNDQIKHELYSAYIYLSMSAYCESINMPGAAHWMRLQAQEEVAHGMKFFDFIIDRGGQVSLQVIDQPPTEFASLLDIFEQALAHEKHVTSLINSIYDVAMREQDYAAQALLQWFVTEQVEEEKNADDVVQTLKMVEGQPAGLFIVDRELGARVLEPDSAEA